MVVRLKTRGARDFSYSSARPNAHSMTARLIRRFAIFLVAFYALGQLAVASAACQLDRNAMAQAMTMSAGDTCDDCVQVAVDALSAKCLAHCTADLQLTPGSPASIPAATYAFAALPKARVGTGPPVSTEPPAAGVPRRILLHSFQV